MNTVTVAQKSQAGDRSDAAPDFDPIVRLPYNKECQIPVLFVEKSGLSSSLCYAT
jgi:hypothetical protein